MKREPGRKEQQLLKEDPGVLAERAMTGDPALERAIGERREDELRQQFRQWWHTLGADETLRYLHERDQLLLLLHEKYGYTPDEASREADALLAQPGIR